MGRNSTGVQTTAEVMRIELSCLLRKKLIKWGYNSSFILSYTAGGDDAGDIKIEAFLADEAPYIRISYSTTNLETGQTEKHNQEVGLVRIPSNLGRGKVLYFYCNRGGPCRILYKAYGSPIFKSRIAYGNRIYYPLQVSSKRNIYNDRYWELEKKLSKLHEGRASYRYKGKLTKKRERINRLIEKQEEADQLRWTLGMGVRLLKLAYNNSG